MRFKNASQRKAVMAKLRVYKNIPNRKTYLVWDSATTLKQSKEQVLDCLKAGGYSKSTAKIVKHKSVSTKEFPYVVFIKKDWVKLHEFQLEGSHPTKK